MGDKQTHNYYLELRAFAPLGVTPKEALDAASEKARCVDDLVRMELTLGNRQIRVRVLGTGPVDIRYDFERRGRLRRETGLYFLEEHKGVPEPEVKSISIYGITGRTLI